KERRSLVRRWAIRRSPFLDFCVDGLRLEDCNPIKRSYRSARMKYARACAVLLFLSVCFRLVGGTPETQVESVRSDFNPPRFDFAIESGYLLGAINAPAGYEIGAEFLTGRIRWGVVNGDTWLRGYHQFYV